MKLANCYLALGGDTNNTVPKRGVTPGEVAVLMAIHGEDAVSKIDLLDDETKTSPRDVLSDLIHRYGGAKNSENKSIVRQMFPQASMLPAEFSDLGLADASLTQASIKKLNGEDASEQPLDKMTVTELKAFAATRDIDLGDASKKADILKAIGAALDGGADDEDDDGIGDMPDSGNAALG